MRADRPTLRAAFAVVLLTFAITGCRTHAPDTTTYARLISYNTQNLFDDTDDGGEYPEFTRERGWTRDRYYERLERLDATIRALGPLHAVDAIVLVELESPSVAASLTHDYLRRFRFVSSGPPRATTTQVVVLTKRRPSRIRTHYATELALVPVARSGDRPVRAAPRVLWRGRDLVDVVATRPAMRLLAAHWKSQSGGERATEARRRLEAALVNGVIAAPCDGDDTPCTPAIAGTNEGKRAERSAPIVLVGDLNEDLDEFRSHGGVWPTALVRGDDVATDARGSAVGSVVFTTRSEEGPRTSGVPDAAGEPVPDAAPWVSGWTDAPAGTYSYRGAWERLDHAFLRRSGTSSYEISIETGNTLELFDDDGNPARYDPRTGRGYSDHLPIVVTISRLRVR